jgi:hypothetical protein
MAASNINTKRLKVTELDFDLIKESFKNYLKGSVSSDGFAFTDYDFEGSGLSAILDVLAYNTHYNAFYTNMIANEMFLDTATLRDSVVSIAKQLGYTPRSVTGAKATVTLNFVASDLIDDFKNADVLIPKGSSFSSTVDDKTYGFVTTKSYTATPVVSEGTDYQVTDVEITEGIYTSVQYAFNSQIKQNFIIPNKNVDTSTIFIFVNDVATGTSGTVYELAKDYTILDSSSAVFFLQETSDELYEIYFGDGNVGRKPADGNIIDISYVVSNGEAINGASIFLSDPIKSPVTTGTTYSPTVATVIRAYAGANRESVDSIKFLAPRNYESQNRAVTTDDYKVRVITDFPQTDAVTCWGGEDNVPPDYGKVYVSIKPKTGYVLTELEKDDIKKNILKPRNVLTIDPIIVDPDYLYLVLKSTVKWDSRLTTLTGATLRTGLIAEMLSWGQSNLEKFETYFRYSALLRIMDDFDPGILNNLTVVKVRKEITPVIGSGDEYILGFSNPIMQPHEGHQGAVTSTTFQYSGHTSCTLSDLNGIIQINGLSATGQNVLIDSSAGTVDYENGIVILSNFAPEIVDNSGILSVTITPRVNDIVPKTNQLITLRDSDISVSMSDDSSAIQGTLATTATGGVTSGTTGSSGSSSTYGLI